MQKGLGRPSRQECCRVSISCAAREGSGLFIMRLIFWKARRPISSAHIRNCGRSRSRAIFDAVANSSPIWRSSPRSRRGGAPTWRSSTERTSSGLPTGAAMVQRSCSQQARPSTWRRSRRPPRTAVLCLGGWPLSRKAARRVRDRRAALFEARVRVRAAGAAGGRRRARACSHRPAASAYCAGGSARTSPLPH